jgi:hypothetical protein
MSDLYLLDEMQLGVLKRVKARLYDESRKLGIDEKRDLANAMDAVLHSVEQYGKLDAEPVNPLSSRELERLVRLHGRERVLAAIYALESSK